MQSRFSKKRWSRTAFIAAAIVALGGSSLAAQGMIRGTVTRADTHSPISGASVSIASPQRVATTDPKGVYVLRDLPAGTYVVTTTAIGRAPDSGSVVVRSSGTVSHGTISTSRSMMVPTISISPHESMWSPEKLAMIS